METKHVDSFHHDLLGRSHDWHVSSPRLILQNLQWLMICDVSELATTRGFVKNYADLFVTRLFLGTAEAGLFPGVSYFLTLWYRR